jgi:hypothetical protein
MRFSWKFLVLALTPLFSTGLIGGCGSDTTGPEKVTSRPMQTLQLVGGVGTFAYFQLLWPHVEVAQADNPNFATIEPSQSGYLIPGDTDGNKEWFATSFAPWIDSNGKPYPRMEITAFLSGINETHTLSPASNGTLESGMGLVAGIASHQSAIRSVVSPLVVVNGPGAYIGTGPNVPTPEHVVNADSMIALYKRTAGVDLTPTPEELTLFDIAGAPAWLPEFGRQMIVAAKAFRNDLSGTILISMPGVDPHGAFNNVPSTRDFLASLQTILNGFHDLLAAAYRANSVMITMLGDTPKNPLRRAGWPDGTPGNCNWVYVVGKGYLKHGWFGRVHADGSVSGYDPTTGADDPNRTSESTRHTTAAATAYAATRGDHTYIENELGGGSLSDYQGVVVPSKR